MQENHHVRKKYFADYIESQIQEIARSKSLRIYGILLSLTHLLAFIFWSKADIFPAQPICWTFIPFCQGLSGFFSEYGSLVFSVYGASSLAAIYFFYRSQIRTAYWLLFVVMTLKFVVQFYDYRGMGNYHYMPNIISLVFLFISNKRHLLRIALIGFYIGAGLIKLNTDWLAGEALTGPGFIPATSKLSEYLLAYVIILELFVSQLLVLSKRKVLFWFAFGQFVVFHIYSIPIVGWFYPSIMACLLSLFVLEDDDVDIKSAARYKMNLIYLALFIVAQIFPILYFTEPSVSGEGRLLSLNMLDAKATCTSYLVDSDGLKTKIERLTPLYQSPRLRCDPLVYIHTIRNYCRKQESSLNTVNFYLNARRTTFAENQNPYSFHLNLLDVCKNPPQVNLLGTVYQK